MSELIWGLMIAALVAKCVCTYSLIARRLALRYPMLTLLLVVGAVRSVALLWVHGSTPAYTARWFAWQPVTIMLHVGAAIEVYVKICLHLRRFLGFSLKLFAVLATISVGITAMTTPVDNPYWHHLAALAFRMVRHESLACLVFLALTVLFFSQFQFLEIRRNVCRHGIILSAMFACLFIGNLIVEQGSGTLRYVVSHQLLVIAGPMACYIAWTFGLTAANEVWRPLPVPSEGEVAALDWD